MLEVRIYRIDDQEAVVALWWDSWHSIRPGLRHPQPLSDWRRRWIDEIVPAQAIVVAKDEGVVVGFAAADVAVSELTQIFVAPSHKRRGIGQELFAWAQRLMPTGFSLHTLVENITSRAFYEHHGLLAGDRRISEVNGLETIEYRWAPSGRRQENRMTTIDQQTRRRMARTGLTALDEERACPGYTLYAPMFGPGTVYLLDLHGREVHQWELPYPPGLYGYLLPNGNLFYGGKIRDETWDRFPAWHRFKGGILLEVDWRGNVVWEHRDRDHHHDARRTPSGGALYLTVERIPDTVAARVQGGVPSSAQNGMWADVLVEIDVSGHRLWEWHAYEHLDVATDIITFNDARDEWSHANTVVPLPGERVLVSFRNISTVAIIDQRTGAFVWKLGYEVLAQQHDPSLLANGNILVFDNGAHRKDQAMPASRVLEVEPTTKTIVWEYHDAPLYNFFSPYISGARRLPNGNTLITEGNLGRMFQVTPDKQVVWEYVNPYFPAGPDGAPVNAVFRATHYLLEDIPALR